MKKFYACEQHALTTYLEKRKEAETRELDKSAGWYEDLLNKAAAMNNVLEIDEINGTAAIRISGVLVDRDADIYDAYYGLTVCPYDAIKKAVAQIIELGIEKTTVYFNTPGGMVSGVEKTRSELKALSELTEVTPVNMGMCCSGGMWLVSGIGPIQASDRTTEAGSIGIVVIGYSYDGMLSNWGVEEHVITNRQSTDKIPDMAQESGRDIIRDELDALYRVFRDNVSEGLNMSAEKIDALKGRVLIGDDAISYGLMIDGYKQNSPAQAVENTLPAQGEKPEEVKQMAKLNEFLSSNPEAKTEHDNALVAQFDAGKKSIQATVAGAAKYLKPDCQYPAAIKALACDVLEGKKSLEALDSAVAVYDSLKESGASSAAQTETAQIGATPGQQVPGASAGGENSNEMDFQAIVANDAAAIGLPAKGGK